ncbi:hypothetical protein MIMGU_mgv11b017350mg [Erythranthe guttata]|uniref:Wall-associated receptor kinase galacturonan-binding domain-containing protein n=1 Tax=Erythranthe guttata TaxID=4155 RepID=A0A022QVL5_ERYGU|nr:hypothetical protein MIMGU_mgv11b017350mg [Erythranthe guttata]
MNEYLPRRVDSVLKTKFSRNGANGLNGNRLPRYNGKTWNRSTPNPNGCFQSNQHKDPPSTITKGVNVTKPGCESKCGNLTVHYPFGIGIDSWCSIHPYFDIYCNNSFNPPKPFSGTFGIEVTDIIDSQLRFKNRIGATCYNKIGKVTRKKIVSDAQLDPHYSISDANKLTVVGFDEYALQFGVEGANSTDACVSTCSSREQVLDEQGRYTFHSSDLDNATFKEQIIENVPVVLDWVIQNETCVEARKFNDLACHKNSNCIDSTTSVNGYNCICFQEYEGNPYLEQGCAD